MCGGNSGRAFQSCRQCSDHEAKLLQDHGCEPVSGGDSVFEKGDGVESRGAIGMGSFCLLLASRPSLSLGSFSERWHELTPFRPPSPLHNQKFTYINLAFSPAPDDTVSNLFKVSAWFGWCRRVRLLRLGRLNSHLRRTAISS